MGAFHRQQEQKIAAETRPRSTEPGFYHAGGSMRADAASYVQRAADRELLAALQEGEFCYVLTSRQMGKSSLMVRTAARLREQGHRVAVLDLSAMGQNLTAEQWYEGLLEELGVRLDLEEELEASWQENRHLGPLRRWMRAVQTVVLGSGVQDRQGTSTSTSTSTTPTPERPNA